MIRLAARLIESFVDVAAPLVADRQAAEAVARHIICEHDALPPISWMAEDAGKPLIVQIVGREMTTIDGKDVHTAMTVRAYRSRSLPALSGITLLGALITALAAFNVFGGSAVSGVKVNLSAGDPTQ